MALFFTPSQPLFASPWDAVWQFHPPLFTPEHFSPDTEQLLPLPTQFFVSGNAGEKSHLSHSPHPLFFLNSFESSRYLVENVLQTSFTLTENQQLFLFFTAKKWSKETLESFDDPGFVIFLDDQLIWREPATDETIWQEYFFSLGILPKGSHSFSFLAGEMGDLEKPSGIELTQIEIFTPQKNSALPFSSPAPTFPVQNTFPVNISLPPFSSVPNVFPFLSEIPDSSPQRFFSHIADSRSQPPSFQTPLAQPSPHHTQDGSLSSQGQVLGSSAIADPQKMIESWESVFHSGSLLLLMGCCAFLFCVIGVFFSRRIFRQKRESSFETPFSKND